MVDFIQHLEHINFEPGGPYFRPQSKNILDWDENFIILTFRANEAINKLSIAQIRTRITSDFIKEAQEKSKIKTTIKTTEEFLASQLLKHVTVQFDRPFQQDVKTEFFALKSNFHGILTSASLEFVSQYDVAVLELKPYFWLLTQQNNYRSFENQTVREIIEAVFKPYTEDTKLNGKFIVKYEFQTERKKIQTIQAGETDFEFVLRLMEEEGLSYFFYHDTNTSVLVITDKISSTLNKIGAEDEFKALTKELTYYPDVSGTYQAIYIEDIEKMPLYDYKVALAPPLAYVTASAYPDYRKADESITAPASQTAKLFLNTDGFELEQTLWTHTNRLSEYQKKDRIDHLTATAELRLESDLSSKLSRSATLMAYGFLPIWRKCNIDLNIDPLRSSIGYLSAIAKSQKFYPYATEHLFIRPLKTASAPTQSHKPVHFQVNVKFCDVGDDTFIPSFEHPQSSTQNLIHTEYNRIYSAEVVEFKKDDKPENNFDVPNMFRIRFPWHKADQSVKARVSFFWTGNKYGSLFMPEVGSEVLVTFLAGDKDYPVIIGSFYNSKNNYPLDVKTKTLEVPSEFGARGVVFHADEAKFVYETVKNGKEETKILTMATAEGNMKVGASNIDIEANKTFTTTVTTPKSSFKMDDQAIFVNGFDNGGTLKIEKNKVSTTSPEVVIDGDAEVKITSGMITANNLRLPK